MLRTMKGLETFREREHLFLIGKTQQNEKNINSLIFISGSIVYPVRGSEMTSVQSQVKLARSSSLQPLTGFSQHKKTILHVA